MDVEIHFLYTYTYRYFYSFTLIRKYDRGFIATIEFVSQLMIVLQCFDNYFTFIQILILIKFLLVWWINCLLFYCGEDIFIYKITNHKKNSMANF